MTEAQIKEAFKLVMVCIEELRVFTPFSYCDKPLRSAMESLNRLVHSEENNEGDVPSPDGSAPSTNQAACG